TPAGSVCMVLQYYSHNKFIHRLQTEKKLAKLYGQKNKPTKQEQAVRLNADPQIDQDFPGFPHLPATPQIITPQTAIEKKWQTAQKKGAGRHMAEFFYMHFPCPAILPAVIARKQCVNHIKY
ncbi:MAG TPA: hypothetical protein VN451_05930, partial [Chitinophagaceae bacterium]|nr:hypothetical protein [Chitinophagaceae bacterium]